MTSIPLRRKETAAAEITALAAGAGPPANKIAARRKLWVKRRGLESVFSDISRNSFVLILYDGAIYKKLLRERSFDKSRIDTSLDKRAMAENFLMQCGGRVDSFNAQLR